MFAFKKRLGGLLLGLAMGFPAVWAQGGSIIDEVIAVVGDNPILRSDVEFQFQQAMMQGANFQGDLKCHIFEQLLLQNLLLEIGRASCRERVSITGAGRATEWTSGGAPQNNRIVKQSHT